MWSRQCFGVPLAALEAYRQQRQLGYYVLPGKRYLSDLTLREAQQLLHWAPSTLYHYVASGQIPSRRQGKHWVLRRQDVVQAQRQFPHLMRQGGGADARA
jgi:hypothetical protein